MGFHRSSGFGVAVATVTLAVLLGAPGCGSTVTSSSDGGNPDAPTGDGATTDAPLTDAPLTDASGGDGGGDSGLTCTLLSNTYDTACGTASDCTTVARGCYCGAQPIIGIAKSAAAEAQACETKSQSQCGLGCANFPGHVAEDGNNDVDGGTIEVLCDASKCHTVLR
jgi:hypothetical protein